MARKEDGEVACGCADWKKGIRSLAGAQDLAWVHGWRYKGRTFVFCPWCSKKLKGKGEGEKRKSR